MVWVSVLKACVLKACFFFSLWCSWEAGENLEWGVEWNKLQPLGCVLSLFHTTKKQAASLSPMSSTKYSVCHRPSGNGSWTETSKTKSQNKPFCFLS